MRLSAPPAADKEAYRAATTQATPGYAYHSNSTTAPYTETPAATRAGQRPHSMPVMQRALQHYDYTQDPQRTSTNESGQVPPAIIPNGVASGAELLPLYPTPARGDTPPLNKPPPLDHEKSIRRCVPLPEVVQGPVSLNPALALTTSTFTTANLVRPPTPQADIDAGYHLCAPATTPSLETMVVVLPSGRPITVHPSTRNVHVVTVGDVLRAVDRSLASTADDVFGQEPPIDLDANGDEVCPCLGSWTGLEFLRSRYRMAGLVRSGQGFDIWELQIAAC